MSVDLNLDEDQRQILDAADSLLATHFPLSRLQGGVPDALEAVIEFGGIGLGLPESLGGAGVSVVEEALLNVAFGRHLVAPAVLAAALAARVAGAAGLTDLATALIGGDRRAALAVFDADGLLLADAAPGGVAIGWRDGQVWLWDLVAGGGQPVAGLDDTVALHRGGPAGAVLAEGGAALALHGDLLVAAQLVGLARAAQDLAVGYAGLRQQFGQPIGAFQAIKHHCANMALRSELASAQLDMAALALAAGHAGDAGFQVVAARQLAAEAALENARTGIQIHGGIGFSAECDAHRFLKRAHLLAQVGGGIELLGLPAPLTPYERT